MTTRDDGPGRMSERTIDDDELGRVSGPDVDADLDPEPAATIFIGALVAFCRTGDLSNDSYLRLCAELRRFVRNSETE